MSKNNNANPHRFSVFKMQFTMNNQIQFCSLPTANSTCYINALVFIIVRSELAPKTCVIDTACIKAAPGQGCPRCRGVVFAAEQVLSKGQEWHRKCFKCKDCNKTLDSIIACDGPDKDVYCKTCYGKNWGPHGYGFACGSGFLQTDGLT